MQSSFARRKGRKIGLIQPDSGYSKEGASTAEADENDSNGEYRNPSCSNTVDLCRLTYGIDSPVVRPSLGVRPGSSKIKRRSNLRTSFEPSGTSMIDDEDEEPTPVVIPRKANLTRQAIEKSALRRPIQTSISSDRFQQRDDAERPSYSADILSELKASTPSTPKDLQSKTDISSVDDGHREIDLASKFGTDLAIHKHSAIPTDAEIKEKKERRARLAKEQDYIALDSDDEPEDGDANDSDSASSSEHEASIMPYTGPKRPKEGPSRTMEDEDELGEGFDEFVSDGRVALGKKAEREQRRQHKEAMKTAIDNAQASDSASENDSDIERRNAYEVAQTRAGMDGLKRAAEEEVRPRRPRTPPRITPLPMLGGVLEELREKKRAVELGRKLQDKRLESVKVELGDIETRKVELQRLMTEAGEKYERLQAEVQAEQAQGEGGNEVAMAERAGLGSGMVGRGLDSMGTVE